MGFIGFLFLVWISFYIEAWIGAVIGVIAFIAVIVGLVRRIDTHQELRLISTLGTLVVIGLFIFFMVR